MTMSGINASSTAAALLPRRVGNAVEPARQFADRRPSPAPASGVASTGSDRTSRSRAAAHPASPIGFLAQAIAQEALLLDIRASRHDQTDSAALYRKVQDDTPRSGPESRIDFEI